jgi:hypothetical protein
MAQLWCEARCNGIADEAPLGCHETAEGAFGAVEARKAAKNSGWRVVDDEWYCPACYKRRGYGK